MEEIDLHKGASSTYYSDADIYLNNADSYDWDVIEHEYGHYVADTFDLKMIGVGGSHTFYEDLSVTYGKSHGIGMAWSEGFATFFAINLQRVMNASSMNIPNVGDVCYNDTDDYICKVNIETVTDEITPSNIISKCESNEITVASILFDCADIISPFGDDMVYINNALLWSVLTTNECQTLSECVNSLYNDATVTWDNKAHLGEVLKSLGLSANSLTITYMNPLPPSLSWTNPSGIHTIQVCIYTINGTQLYQSAFLSNGTTSLNLSTNDWSSIVSSGQNIFYVIIKIWNYGIPTSTDPVTGPYYSTFYLCYTI